MTLLTCQPTAERLRRRLLLRLARLRLRAARPALRLLLRSRPRLRLRERLLLGDMLMRRAAPSPNELEHAIDAAEWSVTMSHGIDIGLGLHHSGETTHLVVRPGLRIPCQKRALYAPPNGTDFTSR
jgi:hypothetical protein